MYNKNLFPKGRWLLCEPEFFDVTYEINPWMSVNRTPQKSLAQKQWQNLHHTLIRLGAWVEYVNPDPKQPDMVFTANAGLIIGNNCILARFRYAERQGEEKGYKEWFENNGFKVLEINSGFFEGEGDALFGGETLFVGYGFRTDLKIKDELQQLTAVKNIVMCELTNSYFYHLDTCFCPIDQNQALYFPGAFSADAIKQMSQHIKLIEIPETDAKKFACNSVVLDKDIVIPAGCTTTCKILENLGFNPYEIELGEYMKAGGASKCLSLKLD